MSFEIVMVELADDRVGGFLDVGVVDQVTLVGMDVPFDDDIKPKRVTVQPTTFVPLGERGQVVGGFEPERFAETDEHRSNCIG